MATGQLEIERKFDVDAAFALPALDGPAGVATVDAPVEHHLDAVYHDTPDLRLLRARVTLRRRVGGADEGWHLKLPSGSARRELHAPLGRAVKNPPRDFLAPVTGILRGARTGPVATLRTRRVVTVLRDDGGRALAEVAHDTVTATALAAGPDEPAEVQSWREVEVELVHGDEQLLTAVGERLVAAGARPSASASKVGRVLAAHLGTGEPPAPGGGGPGGTAGDFVLTAVRNQVAALQQADLRLRTEHPDSIHELRMSAGRLRSTLAAFRAVLDRDATAPLREELAWLGGQFANARDDEAALDHLRVLVAAQPEELVLGPVAARLQQTAIREARHGVDRAMVILSEPRYLQLLDALHGLLDDPPFTDGAGDPVGPVLRKALRRSVRRLRRRMATAGHAPEAERRLPLDDVREATERVRGVAEVCAGELGPAEALLRATTRMQSSLDELQESVVGRELCRRLGLTAFAAGENSFTYGRLDALEQARAEAAERDLRAAEPRLRKALKRIPA